MWWRYILICAVVVAVKIPFVNIENAFASPSNEREPLENYYLRYGYTSMNRALKECEEHFNRDIYLSIKLPKVAFTHQLARCNKGGTNSEFEIEYLNEMDASRHFHISVHPYENRLSGVPFQNDIKKTITLKNGNKAIFGTTPASRNREPIANVLVFEKNNLQYILSVDKRIESTITATELGEIADSLID